METFVSREVGIEQGVKWEVDASPVTHVDVHLPLS